MWSEPQKQRGASTPNMVPGKKSICGAAEKDYLMYLVLVPRPAINTYS